MTMAEKDKELAEMIRKTNENTANINKIAAQAIAGVKNIKFDVTPIKRATAVGAQANAQVRDTNERLNRAIAAIHNKT